MKYTILRFISTFIFGAAVGQATHNILLILILFILYFSRSFLVELSEKEAALNLTKEN